MGWTRGGAHAPPPTAHLLPAAAVHGNGVGRLTPQNTRARSECRLGELMAETPKAEGAGAPGTDRGKATRGTENPASYLSQGIDKNLAKAARAASKR
jgi:hypothetical protein